MPHMLASPGSALPVLTGCFLNHEVAAWGVFLPALSGICGLLQAKQG